jgi:Family of unknown function (DUF6166)
MNTQFQIRCVREKTRNRVFVNGTELDPARSLAIRNHSPDGFNWGYGGSGPAQTALAICLHILDNANAARAVYQDFKWKRVAKWEGDLIETNIDVSDFIPDLKI